VAFRTASSPYDRLLAAFQSITADFSVEDRRKLFHDSAERIYRL